MSTTRTPDDRRRYRLAAACLAFPLVVFVLSYLWLAADHGTLGLWNVVVHESGRYTLRDTTLYFSHFLRETPVVIAYALFLLGAGGGTEVALSRSAALSGRRMIWLGLLGAALLITVSLFLAARSNGWQTALMDLAQFHTPRRRRRLRLALALPLAEHGVFGAAAGLAPFVLNRLAGGAVLQPSRGWTLAAWGFVLALTLAFGLSTEVFADVQYAGHQAREVLAHGLVTLPLGLGLLLLLGRPDRGEPGAGVPWLYAALTIAVPAFLAAVALSGDVMEAGQSEHGLAAMVAAHTFEHTLDLLFIVLLLLVGAGLQTARRHA
jgi:hypothetical protein